jgi:putative redox protein
MAGPTVAGGVAWDGEQRFTGTSGEVSIAFDGDSKAAPSPVQALLLAGASCTGIDVVLILEKMRINLRSLRIECRGERREAHPRRFEALQYTFVASGDGLDRDKLERAVALSVEKYCSVLASLAPDIRVTHQSRVES